MRDKDEKKYREIKKGKLKNNLYEFLSTEFFKRKFFSFKIRLHIV